MEGVAERISTSDALAGVASLLDRIDPDRSGLNPGDRLECARLARGLAGRIGALADLLLAEADRARAAMGATGTPGFFVNGVRQVGWGSYLALKSIVQREIDKGEELIAGGTPRNQVIAKRIAALADKNTKGEGEAAIDATKWAQYLTKD